jgi:hypothetical protein
VEGSGTGAEGCRVPRFESTPNQSLRHLQGRQEVQTPGCSRSKGHCSGPNMQGPSAWQCRRQTHNYLNSNNSFIKGRREPGRCKVSRQHFPGDWHCKENSQLTGTPLAAPGRVREAMSTASGCELITHNFSRLRYDTPVPDKNKQRAGAFFVSRGRVQRLSVIFTHACWSVGTLSMN